MNVLAGWRGLAALGASALFAATVFLNAGLLIAVQPMISKMLLPLLGGAPAVWNTSLVFFQTTLLLGYGYAHLAATRLDSRFHVGCHLALVVLGLVLLPLSVDARPFGSFTAADHPVIWVLLRLAVTVGLPFLALSAGAPALQVWFSSVPHVRGRDPYVLYAASNVGSLIALLSYPVLVEPQLSLRRQAELWTVGYAGLLLLLVACALSMGATAPDHGVAAAGPVVAAAFRRREDGVAARRHADRCSPSSPVGRAQLRSVERSARRSAAAPTPERRPSSPAGDPRNARE